MESKFDLLLSFLLADDAKKGEKALVTKCGPELKSLKMTEKEEVQGDQEKIRQLLQSQLQLFNR